MDGLNIPEPILITVSLGTKFIYDSRFSQDVYNDYQDTIHNTRNAMAYVNFICLITMKQTLRQIKYDNLNRCIDNNTIDYVIKAYLRQCLHSTNSFFRAFESIVTINADKGNVMIILNTSILVLPLHII